MTTAQWIFQYMIAQEAEQDEDSKIEIILQYLKLVGSMANPEAGKKLAELEEIEKHKKEISEENFDDIYNDADIPDEISVTFSKDNDNIELPKYRRTPGIKTKGGGNIDGTR